jgi:hypothetical protein
MSDSSYRLILRCATCDAQKDQTRDFKESNEAYLNTWQRTHGRKIKKSSGQWDLAAWWYGVVVWQGGVARVARGGVDSDWTARAVYVLSLHRIWGDGSLPPPLLPFCSRLYVARSKKTIKVVVFQRRRSSHLCYTLYVFSQCQTIVKLNRVFFPR